VFDFMSAHRSIVWITSVANIPGGGSGSSTDLFGWPWVDVTGIGQLRGPSISNTQPGIQWLDMNQQLVVVGVNGGWKEKAQISDMSEKKGGAWEISTLTGVSGQEELDGGNLGDNRPLFMLEMEAFSTTSTAVFSIQSRSTVSP
jgi:hypothetical protein